MFIYPLMCNPLFSKHPNHLNFLYHLRDSSREWEKSKLRMSWCHADYERAMRRWILESMGLDSWGFQLLQPHCSYQEKRERVCYTRRANCRKINSEESDKSHWLAQVLIIWDRCEGEGGDLGPIICPGDGSPRRSRNILPTPETQTIVPTPSHCCTWHGD